MVEIQTGSGISSAEQGVVVVDGPGGIAVTLTPTAARGMARGLNEAADEADTQPEAAPG